MTKTFDLQRFDTKMLAPSRKFVARAIPVENGYIAQFSAPGLVPRYIGWDQDNPKVFATAEAAENEARLAALEVANKPRDYKGRGGRKFIYTKLSGPDFAVLLAEANLSVNLFAHLMGTHPDRVQSWIDGTDFAPHPARVLLEIFKAFPDAVDLAENVTDAVSEERKPR